MPARALKTNRLVRRALAPAAYNLGGACAWAAILMWGAIPCWRHSASCWAAWLGLVTTAVVGMTAGRRSPA